MKSRIQNATSNPPGASATVIHVRNDLDNDLKTRTTVIHVRNFCLIPSRCLSRSAVRCSPQCNNSIWNEPPAQIVTVRCHIDRQRRHPTQTIGRLPPLQSIVTQLCYTYCQNQPQIQGSRNPPIVDTKCDASVSNPPTVDTKCDASVSNPIRLRICQLQNWFDDRFSL